MRCLLPLVALLLLPEAGLSIDLNPGSTWATVIDANQDAGEVFIIKAGTHTGQQAPLRHLQKLLGEGGVTVNGNGVATLGLQNNQPNGIEVGGLDPQDPPDIHSYAPGNQQAVITAINGGSGWGGDDWLLHDMILRDSADSVDPTLGWGVDMGDNTTLLRLDISGMGKAGVNWSGPNGQFTQGSSTENSFRSVLTGGGLIDDCDIHNNAPNGGNDSGGISKIVHGAKGRVVRNSRFWGNRRANIWCDFLGSHPSFDQMGVLGRWSKGWLEIVQTDLFEVGAGTLAEALFLEVTSGVHLHHSRIYSNNSVGGSGLDGAHVIAHNAGFNTIEDCIFWDSRTRACGVHQSNRYGGGKLITCEGNIFRRNTIIATNTGQVWLAGISSVGTGSPNFQLLEAGGGGTFNAYTQGNNIYEDNKYLVLDTLDTNTSGVLFNRADNGSALDFAGWQAEGFDVGGSYTVLSAGQLPSEVPPMPALPTLASRRVNRGAAPVYRAAARVYRVVGRRGTDGR